MSEKEIRTTTTNFIDELVNDWMISIKFDNEDYEKTASDLAFSVLERLGELSKKDRKLFCERVKSANQNGN